MSMKEIWTLPLFGIVALHLPERRERETIFIAETRNEKSKQQTNKQKETNQKIITESANICTVFFERMNATEMQNWLASGLFSVERRWKSTSGCIYGFSLPRRKRFLGCRNKLRRKRGEQRWSSGITGGWMLGQWLEAESSAEFKSGRILLSCAFRAKFLRKNQSLPDLGGGFCWSSMACSKKRFLSETVLGVRADGGGVGDWNLSRRMTGKNEKNTKLKLKSTQASKTNLEERKRLNGER